MSRDAVSPRDELIEPLAKAAHALWCDGLLREGWQCAEQYDSSAKTDPCLRPFAELAAFDRDHLLDVGVWSEVIETACRSIDFTLRFASSELRASDVAIGAHVRLTPGETTKPEEDVWEGQVVELKPSGCNSGRLLSIGVKWQDGSTAQYLPHELEVVGV